MVEYSYQEAVDLLNQNLSQGKESLVIVHSELDTLKDRITETEVNIARVINWNIREKRRTGGSSAPQR